MSHGTIFEAQRWSESGRSAGHSLGRDMIGSAAVPEKSAARGLTFRGGLGMVREFLERVCPRGGTGLFFVTVGRGAGLEPLRD